MIMAALMTEKTKWITLNRSADPERDGAQDRAPEQVALMHLREEREHQQPGRSESDEEPRIASARVAGSAEGAKDEGAEVNQAQRPLQVKAKWSEPRCGDQKRRLEREFRDRPGGKGDCSRS